MFQALFTEVVRSCVLSFEFESFFAVMEKVPEVPALVVGQIAVMGHPFVVAPSSFEPSFAAVPSFVAGTSFAVRTSFVEEASSVGRFASCVAAFSLPLSAGSGIH
jgi:hypothetical protein